MNDWPGEKELRLYQRLIAFFAQPAIVRGYYAQAARRRTSG